MSYFQSRQPSFLQKLEEDFPPVPQARQYASATRDISANYVGYAGPSVSRDPQSQTPLPLYPTFLQHSAATSYIPMYAVGGPPYLYIQGCPPVIAPLFMVGDIHRHAQQMPPHPPTDKQHHARSMDAFDYAGLMMPHNQSSAAHRPQHNVDTVHSYTPASYPTVPVSHRLIASTVHDVKPVIIDTSTLPSGSRPHGVVSTSARHRFRPIRPLPEESGVGPIRGHHESEGMALRQDTKTSRMSVKQRKAADRLIPEADQVPGVRELPKSLNRPRRTRGAPLGTTPYGCESCGQGYGREADLARHLQNDRPHKEPAFKCNGCGHRFTRKDALMKHKRESCSAR